MTEVTTGKKACKKLQTLLVWSNLQLQKRVSFPVRTPTDIFAPSTKSQWYKDFEYEQSYQKECELFYCLNYKITEILSSLGQKSMITSLKKLTCQKLYSTWVNHSEKQSARMFDQLMHLKVLEQETSKKNLSPGHQVTKLGATVDKLKSTS